MVTTPAGTLEAAPQTTSWNVGRGSLDKIDVVIPAGHVGLTGFALRWGGRQLVPYEAGEWITGNDDEVTLELGLYTGSGILEVATFNLDDAFPHSHHLRAYVQELDAAADRDLDLVPIGGPAVPELGDGFVEPGVDLDDEEDAIVTAAGDAFLADLQNVLEGFLFELRSTLEGVPAPPGGVPSGGIPSDLPGDVVPLSELEAALVELAVTQEAIGTLEAALSEAPTPESLEAARARAAALKVKAEALRERLKKAKERSRSGSKSTSSRRRSAR